MAAAVAVEAVPVNAPINVVAVTTPVTNILPPTPTPPATCNAPVPADVTPVDDVRII